MNYKDIIKNKNTRMAILHYLEWIPDSIMVKMQYFLHTGRIINLNNPKTFTEKIQWYKLYYRKSIMTECVDKFAAKKYVATKLKTDKYIIPTIGHWQCANEINFDDLPDKCVLKTTNGSGTNIFFERGENTNVEGIRKQLDIWLKQVNKSAGREWAYDNVKGSIICEPILESIGQAGKGLDDYKFFCFNGKVAMKWVDYDRFAGHKRVLFDRDGKRLDIACTYPSPQNFNCPNDAFDVLQPIAEKLAEDFPHARIDLYYTNNKAYFGEITFYSGSGYEMFSDKEYDLLLGHEFILPKIDRG